MICFYKKGEDGDKRRRPCPSFSINIYPASINILPSRSRKDLYPQAFGMLAGLYNAHGLDSLADIVYTKDVGTLQK